MRWTRQRSLAILISCALIGAIGCGLISLGAPSHRPGGAAASHEFMVGADVSPLHFASSVSYDQALRIVTDLGLQPSVACGNAEQVQAGSVIQGLIWRPAGQQTLFAGTHTLFASPTLLVAPDWPERLTAILGHPTAQQESRPVYCPAPVLTSGGAPPPSGTPLALTFAQVGTFGTYARVTFAHQVDTYDQALYAVSNLGVRLADPCLEHQARAPGASPTWHPVGQEQTFAATHTLLVATSGLATSTLWQRQLRGLSGVSGVALNVSSSC